MKKKEFVSRVVDTHHTYIQREVGGALQDISDAGYHHLQITYLDPSQSYNQTVLITGWRFKK